MDINLQYYIQIADDRTQQLLHPTQQGSATYTSSSFLHTEKIYYSDAFVFALVVLLLEFVFLQQRKANPWIVIIIISSFSRVITEIIYNNNTNEAIYFFEKL